MLFRLKNSLYLLTVLLMLELASFYHYAYADLNVNESKIGTVVDEFNGVKVYYNGNINHVSSRNVAKDGYNLGLKYQCVEFIKRYYYERFNHKMPDSYGHAKDFFDDSIPDGKINTRRNLLQFHNGSTTKPKVEDIIVQGWSQYGHVAIISRVSDNEIEIVQQNLGPNASSRVTFALIYRDGLWKIESYRVFGYLRKR